MDDKLESKLVEVETRFDELMGQMGDPAIANDYARFAELNKQRNELEPVIDKFREFKQLQTELADNEELAAGNDAEMAEMAQVELEPLRAKIDKLTSDLRALLVPKDPRDDRDVIVEIRAGAGGDEAGLFAADLSRMYMRYADGRRWKVEIVDENESGIGGYKEIIFQVKGKGA